MLETISVSMLILWLLGLFPAHMTILEWLHAADHQAARPGRTRHRY
jgi:hypothetical protein